MVAVGREELGSERTEGRAEHVVAVGREELDNEGPRAVWDEIMEGLLGFSVPALSTMGDGILADGAVQVPKTQKRKSAAVSPTTSPRAAAAQPSASPPALSDISTQSSSNDVDSLRAEPTNVTFPELARPDEAYDEIDLVDSDDKTSSSSEDEESLFESPQSKRRRNRQRLTGRPGYASAAAGCIDQSRLQKPRDISTPLSAIQHTCLSQIEKREDRHLLRLFWAHGWTAPASDTDLDMSTAKCFVFLKHQFLALRFVAGTDGLPCGSSLVGCPCTNCPLVSLRAFRCTFGVATDLSSRRLAERFAGRLHAQRQPMEARRWHSR